ncbi:MAG: restriction endonuclease subunit S [Rhodobacteraceae bacterium]|jgi:type I restriction enzyme S subunit|nr:restriction endonuclease subunit S [Paracoccaceae bacterium]MBL4558988.1 restriction endonuclease subunit S [Paracoccaceae bacterium]
MTAPRPGDAATARLLALYEMVAEAPDAVPRLRRFVLDLAVRGKLVPQAPGDEPALELLKRIAAAKARLVKAGEIRKKAAQNPNMVEPPHELPASWRWVSLGTVFLYDAGAKREPKSLDPSLWLLELEDIEKEPGRLLARIAVTDRESKSTKSEFRVGDILYGKLRPYLTKVLVADAPGYSTTEIVAIRPFLPLCSEYCALALRCPDFVDYVTRLGQGTKMPRLRTEDAVVSPFPLPPLAERRRIVAKVEELMALLDRLEAARIAREANRDRLTAASLARLTAPDTEASSGKVGTGFPSDDATNKNSAEFPAKARFALATLPALTTRPDQIKPLRQTILNLAVRGKLVAQDPTDEPASELLKRIAAEKARMVKAGEIKVRKLQARGRSEPLDLSLPKGWVLTELGAVALKITDGAHKTPTFVDRGVPFVSVKDFSGGKLDLSNTRFIPEAEHQVLYQRFDPQRGDILLGRIGTLGKAVLVDADVEFSLFVSVGLIRFDHQNLLPEFFRLLLNSPFVEEEFDRIKIGGGTHTNKLNLASINMTQLRGCPIPLPPLAEQHRIVAKVDALMALCDRLDSALTTTDTTRARLLEALLHDALDPAGITGAAAAGSAGAGPNVDALHQTLPNPRQQPPLPRVNRAI